MPRTGHAQWKALGEVAEVGTRAAAVTLTDSEGCGATEGMRGRSESTLSKERTALGPADTHVCYGHSITIREVHSTEWPGSARRRIEHGHGHEQSRDECRARSERTSERRGGFCHPPMMRICIIHTPPESKARARLRSERAESARTRYTRSSLGTFMILSRMG